MAVRTYLIRAFALKPSLFSDLLEGKINEAEEAKLTVRASRCELAANYVTVIAGLATVVLVPLTILSKMWRGHPILRVLSIISPVIALGSFFLVKKYKKDVFIHDYSWEILNKASLIQNDKPLIKKISRVMLDAAQIEFDGLKKSVSTDENARISNLPTLIHYHYLQIFCRHLGNVADAQVELKKFPKGYQSLFEIRAPFLEADIKGRKELIEKKAIILDDNRQAPSVEKRYEDLSSELRLQDLT